MIHVCLPSLLVQDLLSSNPRILQGASSHKSSFGFPSSLLGPLPSSRSAANTSGSIPLPIYTLSYLFPQVISQDRPHYLSICTSPTPDWTHLFLRLRFVAIYVSPMSSLFSVPVSLPRLASSFLAWLDRPLHAITQYNRRKSPTAVYKIQIIPKQSQKQPFLVSSRLCLFHLPSSQVSQFPTFFGICNAFRTSCSTRLRTI